MLKIILIWTTEPKTKAIKNIYLVCVDLITSEKKENVNIRYKIKK